MKIIKLISTFILLTSLLSPALAEEDTEKLAIIQGLNKITAKTSILEIKIGEKLDFGQISIIAHKCWQAPLDQKPESKILLEVFQNKRNVKTRIFYGWMFASSPSISGLEHPIYDLTALSCKLQLKEL